MDEKTKQEILSLMTKAEDAENHADSDFRRGRAIGEQHGIEKALRAMGLVVVFDDEMNACDIREL
jgi:hypothetical protein